MILVEPGHIVTRTERKVYEDSEKMDLSGTDEEAVLPYSTLFASLGQMWLRQVMTIMLHKLTIGVAGENNEEGPSSVEIFLLLFSKNL